MGVRRVSRRPLALLAGIVPISALLVATALPAVATTPRQLYAYAAGMGTAAGCPQDPTATAANECSFAESLSQAAAGDTIYLATPGGSASYVGNWTAATTGTSATSPLTISAAPGLASRPILDGNNGSDMAPCSTGNCDGPILTVGTNLHLSISGITIQNALNTTSISGGGIDNATGTLTIDGVTFSDDRDDDADFGDGGAINNGEGSGPATLTVSDSVFEHGSAFYGGAIANGGSAGGSTLTVVASTFTDNSSSFGGAIDTEGSSGRPGVATISRSTFDSNTSAVGGAAIDNADASIATLTVSESTFTGNAAGTRGGAIANGADTGSGTLSVVGSTFAGDSAEEGGDEVGQGGNVGGAGSVTVVAGDLFAGSCESDAGTWTDDGHNAGADGSCLKSATGDVSNAAVGTRLSPLAHNNGAAVETIAPTLNNPAVNLVPNGATAVHVPAGARQLCPRTDQTGRTRGATAVCDAGAIDFSAFPPKITAVLSDGGHRPRRGWYRFPVTVSFRCTTAGSPLSGRCPGSVRFTASGRHRITRSIAGTDGGRSTVAVLVRLDRTPPSLKVTGAKNHKTYRRDRHLRCVAHDALSGVASCKIHKIDHAGITKVRWKATATDVAGNVRHRHGYYFVKP